MVGLSSLFGKSIINYDHYDNGKSLSHITVWKEVGVLVVVTGVKFLLTLLSYVIKPSDHWWSAL